MSPSRSTICNSKSVCIIGAGPSGLTTIKNIIAYNSSGHQGPQLKATVFEQSSSIGGVWNYDEELAQTIFHNPMYIGLRINFPKQLMRFIDFPADQFETEDTYISRKDIFDYLVKYADVNQLKSYIKVNRKVTSVKPIFQDNSSNVREPKWMITVQNTENPSDQWNYEFDSVIICSGSHTKQRYPENSTQIQTDFKGKILHSVEYNTPEIFRNQTVLLIGGGPSGRDLALDISGVGKQVFLSLNDYDNQTIQIPEKYSNVKQIRRIKIAKEYSVITEDECELDCDVIIFCTGYEYDYAYLESGIINISAGGKCVTPLFMDMIHQKYISLWVLGVGDLHMPFYLSDCQSRFYVKYLIGEISLPSEARMVEEYNLEQSYRKKYKLVGSKSHVFYGLQWEYIRRLAVAAGFAEEIEEDLQIFEKVYFTCIAGTLKTPFTYRDQTFEMILKDSATEVEDPTGINLDLSEFPFHSNTYSFGSDSDSVMNACDNEK